MSEEEVTGTLPNETGPVEAAPDGITAQAPDVAVEPATEPTTPTEPVFFDAESLPDELKGRYGEMQSSYTQKMQDLGKQRKALEQTQALVDAYQRDPIGTLQQLAAQSGVQVVQPGQQQTNEPQEPWQPQTWDDVSERTVSQAKQEILQELAPHFDQLRDIQASSVETQLDGLDPMWRQYEDKMTELVNKHPSLANDIPALYDLSVPQDVREAKATQRALAKLKAQGNSAQPAGSSTRTTTTAPATPVSNFDEAVAAARQKLEAGG
jgi:hypothetical protein